MSQIFRVYQNFLRRYPFGMQAFQAGILMGIGDQIAQNLVEKRPLKNLDYVRTGQFAVIGFCMVGPATRTWYGLLDKYVGSKGAKVVLKKVVYDQLLFTPIFVAALLSVISVTQGNDVTNTKLKLEDEYVDILLNNYKLWPAVQLVNFYLVPLNHQVLVVQTVALLWNTYISYRTNRGKALHAL
ncbi:hypothetical protein QAD02_001844 [Eretmocerus hayati]|uniref:Uncharacterized protein n=1 Tax=Eretmocerus hayati TaxID=131215 RepID=A0ACC2NHA2_9HYME|nr:hypothetical protein QAD02_001844 [Eretmocerus hayati]